MFSTVRTLHEQAGTPLGDKEHVGTLARTLIVDADDERAIIEHRYPTPLVATCVIELDSGHWAAAWRPFAPHLRIWDLRGNYNSLRALIIHDNQLTYA